VIIGLASMSFDSSAVVGTFVTVNKGVCFKDSNRMMDVLEANACLCGYIYVCVLDALLVDVDQPEMSAPCARSISLASMYTDSSAAVATFVTVNKGVMFKVTNPMMHVMRRTPGCVEIFICVSWTPFLCRCVCMLVRVCLWVWALARLWVRAWACVWGCVWPWVAV